VDSFFFFFFFFFFSFLIHHFTCLVPFERRPLPIYKTQRKYLIKATNNTEKDVSVAISLRFIDFSWVNSMETKVAEALVSRNEFLCVVDYYGEMFKGRQFDLWSA